MSRRGPRSRGAARSSQLVVLLALAFAFALALAANARAAEWEPFPLPVPPGGQFATPPGTPGDLAFWAPNRGVMTVAGNASVPAGVYGWNGRAWHQLATVCGPLALTDGEGAVAWAGPTEFWTIAMASPGVIGAFGALCHFKDGVVVDSFGTPNVPGYDSRVNAAACRAPDDCWFGGAQSQSADAAQIGAFHLRWDGTRVTPLFAPQGRAVSDLQAIGGRIAESVRVGAGAGPEAPLLRQPEAVPALLHWIDGGAFSNDAWIPAPVDRVPADGTELLALDSDGTTAWAVGGGAGSGPSTQTGPVGRLPVAARLDGGNWVELALSGSGLRTDEVFADVAAIPGTRAAWAVLRRSGARVDPFGQPRVAYIAPDGQVTVQQLAQGGIDPARGEAMHVACPAADDCWIATARGYVYRWGGPKEYPVDEDPAFQGTITERPNEGAAQFLPDTPPADDSRLHAPPVELPTGDEQPPRSCARPPRLMSGVRAPRFRRVPGQPRSAKDPRFRIVVRFRLARRARVALIAERRRSPRRVTRVVARTPLRTLRPGSRSLSLTVRRTSWPTRLRFVLREAARPRCEADATTAGARTATR